VAEDPINLIAKQIEEQRSRQYVVQPEAIQLAAEIINMLAAHGVHLIHSDDM
jgi:hypothetical protein